MERVQKTRLWLLFLLLIPCWVIAAHYDIDLVNLYAAAKFAATDLTRVYAQNGNLGRYFYGPFSLVLVKWMPYFSYTAVKWFWIVLQTVCYVVFWIYLTRLYPILKQSRAFWGWLLVWIVSINPIHNNYQSNNIQLMLAAVLVLAECLTYSRSVFREFLAGVLTAMAASIKVFPLFLLAYYLLAKPKATRLGAILGMLVANLLPFLFFGAAGGKVLYHGFLSNLTTYGNENNALKVVDILCLPSMVSRWMNAVEIPPGPWTSIVVLACIGIVSLGFFVWVLRAERQPNWHDPRTQIHFWAMACALMVFLNPSSRPHYFIFYVPAFCSLVEMIYEQHKVLALNIGVFLATLLIAFTAQGVVGKTLNDRLEGLSVPTFGMLILCVVLAVAITRNQRQVRWF